METNFNFKSQPCTTVEQSERLLALGLKKETADVIIPIKFNPEKGPILVHQDFWISDDPFYQNMRENSIPAWSLGRLLEMMPQIIDLHDFVLFHTCAGYINNDYHIKAGFNGTFFDACISCIEWLINEELFNKEYLV